MEGSGDLPQAPAAPAAPTPLPRPLPGALDPSVAVTVLCLFLTVLILRGTVGAGRFGTPQQDLIELRHRFISHPQQSALAEDQSTRSKASDAQPKKPVAVKDDEPEPPPRSLRDPPYTLGPKISDWDKQRAAWNARHPETPPFLNDVKPCENSVGDHYLLKSIKNKMDYCRIHDIEIFYNMALGPHRPPLPAI